MNKIWLRLLDPQLDDMFAAIAGKGAASGPEARLALAHALNLRSRHAEAQELLDALLAEDRANGDAWFERVLCEGEHADDEDLRILHEQIEAVRDEHPDVACHRRNLGFLRIIQHRLDDAERALEQALRRDARDPKTLELSGLLALQRDEPQEAKALLLKALSLSPKDPSTLRLLGLTLAQLGDAAGAEAQFSAAVETEPFYFWGWHSLGELLLRKGPTDAGLRCIHRARAIHIKEASSYFILADLLGEQGHIEVAMSELHQLFLLAPKASILAEAQSLLGEFCRDKGDRECAQSYFSLAAETDPDSANPWAALGDMAREDLNWDAAIHCYQEALVREPEAADILVQLGYAQLELGHVEKGELNFLSALESDPSEYSAYLGLSECYRQAGRHEDQASMVEQAMTLAPDDADVWNAHGVSLEGKERMAEATTAYEKALELHPEHRKAANNLGFLLEKRMERGETELKARAVDAWKRRYFLCLQEGQSTRMAREHLQKLGVAEDEMRAWSGV
ncbi:MAG: tetratricopeptide repeat protein [Holophagaceae bacterium]|nr:tetratricopeptide repeat protein [Holophagaceae bacterium]